MNSSLAHTGDVTLLNDNLQTQITDVVTRVSTLEAQVGFCV